MRYSNQSIYPQADNSIKLSQTINSYGRDREATMFIYAPFGAGERKNNKIK